MITENLSTLKIHKLTQEQYDRELAAGRVDANALYLTPEEEIDLSPYATIEQLNGKADAEHEHSIEDINNLQSSLDSKQNTITGAATTITGSNLTESRALVSDSSGKVAVSDITSTELGYLDGVTSNVQVQLNARVALDKTLVTMPSSSTWKSITYGNGKFVAVADGCDTVAYSTDGINWTTSNLLSAKYWYSVTYGNGKFVAIAYNSKTSAYSTDGINWTVSDNLPSLDKWWSVTYGNDKFVVVTGHSNAAAYSTDGINWTASDNLPEKDIWCVTYGDGKFVAIGQYSSIAACSTDGIHWTETKSLPSDNYWESIAYGNGKFVAVQHSNSAAYSIDGVTWKSTDLRVSTSWKSITYGNGKFVAVAYSTSVYSTDGIHWTETNLPSSSNWCSITYGNSKFVAIVKDSNKVAYSIDGINWKDGELGLFQNNADVTAEVADVISKNLTDVVYAGVDNPEATSAPINADTLGGQLPSAFAPAGYGLGSGCKSVSSWNEATVTGWYYAKNDSIDGNYWFGMVVKHPNSEALTQTAYNHLTAIQTTRISVRGRDANGVWGAWEWVNPPMTLGVEYRTTERWNDSAVYTKLVNFGALPNNTNKSISTGLTSNNIVRYYTTVNSGGKIFNLPYFMSNGAYKIKELVNSDGKYYIYTADDYSSANAVVQFWYIKS